MELNGKYLLSLQTLLHLTINLILDYTMLIIIISIVNYTKLLFKPCNIV